MVVRETTHRFSRLSFHRAMVGRRLPLLLTASGLTWLAFAPEHERSPIVEMLAARPEAEYQLAREPENWPPSSNAPGKTATAKTFAAGSRRRKSLPLPSPFAASSGLSAA